MILYV